VACERVKPNLRPQYDAFPWLQSSITCICLHKTVARNEPLKTNHLISLHSYLYKKLQCSAPCTLYVCFIRIFSFHTHENNGWESAAAGSSINIRPRSCALFVAFQRTPVGQIMYVLPNYQLSNNVPDINQVMTWPPCTKSRDIFTVMQFCPFQVLHYFRIPGWQRSGENYVMRTTVDQWSRNSSQKHNYICMCNDVPTTYFGRFLTGHHQVSFSVLTPILMSLLNFMFSIPKC